MKVVVVQQDLVTAWGRGMEACWAGLLSGSPAFTEVTRFSTKAFQAHLAAQVPGLPEGGDASRVMRMLTPLLAPLAGTLPEGTLILLATTTGEVDLLEREMMSGAPSEDQSRLDVLLGRIQSTLGVTGPGRIISAACASSSVAIAQGAALIASGERDSVLVVACDAVTEFVYAGFASLMALDPEGARPFDKARKGLTVGEAAGTVWLMSEDRARRENRPSLGEVAGWGMSCDANHMTGPSRDGGGLVRAIEKALKRADLRPGNIGSVSAHGTGTLYNDSMELKAFQTVFSEKRVPVYSVKGSLGHTMGATGLIEMMVALKSMEQQVVPPSANLHEVDPEAVGWVSQHAVKVDGMNAVLSTNSGFGGVNAALVLKS
jgi:3-oxoacyl-[acyl-carrier-protein] synthase II